jgi:hypothetical protein
MSQPEGVKTGEVTGKGGEVAAYLVEIRSGRCFALPHEVRHLDELIVVAEAHNMRDELVIDKMRNLCILSNAGKHGLRL